MFERMTERAARLARTRAEARARELAQKMEAELPGGIRVEATERGLRLSGRGLAARFALDGRLRWLAAELGR